MSFFFTNWNEYIKNRVSKLINYWEITRIKIFIKSILLPYLVLLLVLSCAPNKSLEIDSVYLYCIYLIIKNYINFIINNIVLILKK